MRDIKVSVIVPVYNAEKHLRQCIDSIAAQTLKDIEIILVDDGSKDSSLSILREYEEKDERVKVITQENAGAGAARNHGMKEAQGRYYSFLDSDDFFEEDMLEKAYEEAERIQADFVVFRSDQYREDLNEFVKVTWTLREKEIAPYQPKYFRNMTDNVFKVFVGWAWDKLYRADFVKKYGLEFQEIRTSNDMRFVFTALVLAKKIGIVDKILAHQRRNDPSSLSNTREKSWDCFHTALLSLKENLEKYGLYRELEQDYINYALHFSLWNVNTIKGEKKEVLFKKLKEEWFEELGISTHPSSYFYNKTEYREYETIHDQSYASWLRTLK